MLRRDRARADDLAQLRPELFENLRMLQAEVNRPRKGGGGRFVPGDKEGDHLITEFNVAHWLARFVARLDEHRQHILTSGAASRPALCNLSEQDLVYLAHELHHAPPPGERAEDALQPGN